MSLNLIKIINELTFNLFDYGEDASVQYFGAYSG